MASLHCEDTRALTFFFLTHTVQRSCFTALAYFGVEYSHAVPLHCEDTRALTFFFRCVFFFGSQRLMPPWSSFLRITLTTPPKVWFCYTTLLHYFTTLLYYTTLLHYFTTLLYWITLTTPPKVVVPGHVKVGAEVTIKKKGK